MKLLLITAISICFLNIYNIFAKQWIKKLDPKENFVYVIDIKASTEDSLVRYEYNHTNYTFNDDSIAFVNGQRKGEEIIRRYSRNGKLKSETLYYLDSNSESIFPNHIRFHAMLNSVFVRDKKLKIDSARKKFYDTSGILIKSTIEDYKTRVEKMIVYHRNGKIKEKITYLGYLMWNKNCFDKKGKPVECSSGVEHKPGGVNLDNIGKKLVYPDLMKRAGIEAKFHVALVLDNTGKATKLMYSDFVLPNFIKSVVKAVKSTTFISSPEGVEVLLVEFRLT